VLNKIILPSAYLGSTVYYAIIIKHKCIIEANENFNRRSIRNHCNIYAANGKLKLSIPIKKASKKKITDIKICYEENWQKKHWNSINTAYNSSPFFKYYKDELHTFFIKKETYLFSFTQKIQQTILRLLNFENNITNTKIYKKKGEFLDLRHIKWNNNVQEKYDQVFFEKHGFIQNLSIIDLLFNYGPETQKYLQKINIDIFLNHIKNIS